MAEQLNMEKLYRKRGRGTAAAPGPAARAGTHPNTRAAGEKIARRPRKTRSQRERILVYLLSACEGTRREIAERLGLLENSVAMRLRELETPSGFVRRDGTREYQGHVCERWVLTDEGRIAAVKTIEEKPNE